MLKRFGYFVFGIAAYLIFLATFLYAIAFVGGIGIHNGLDGPLSGSAIIGVTIDLILLMVFAVQHSVMARPWFKERWTQIVPWAIERSTYVLCASLALLLLFWQWRPLGGEIWTVENPVGRAFLWTIFGLGWTTVLCVTFLISHRRSNFPTRLQALLFLLHSLHARRLHLLLGLYPGGQGLVRL